MESHPKYSLGSAITVNRLTALLAAALCGSLALPASAQLNLPANHPGTAISQPTNYHLLFTDAELAQARLQWNTPATYVHSSFLASFNSIKSNSQSRSNMALAVTQPTDFTTSGQAASIAQAKALRWLMEDADLDPTTGTSTQIAYFNQVREALTVARLTGGSALTRSEVAMGYLAAFDMINPYLDTWDVANSLAPGTSRATITARLNGSCFQSQLAPGISNIAGNQGVKIGGALATFAMLVGNESVLDTRLGTVRTSFQNASTNDGFWTDGQRYNTYGMVSFPNMALSYQRIQSSPDATGAAQYTAAAEQLIRFNISTAQPNGNSTLMHNGEESPIPLILLGRIVDDTDLKSAALWHFQRSGGMSVGWSSWTNIGNSQDDYLGTDFFVGGDFTVPSAQPTWSPTYHSGGQAHTAVFKNDWGTTSNFLLVTGGIDGGSTAGFTHHDTGAISIAANGTPVIAEPGYNRTGLSNTPSGFNVQLAHTHNVLLARNTGGTITTTSWGIGTATGQTNTGNNMTTTNRLDSLERATSGTYKGVMDFNTLKATYTGTGLGTNVQMRRSTGMVNETDTDKGYFVMADSFRSTAGPNKDFAVNLLGKSNTTNTETVVETSSYVQLRWSMNGLSHTMSGVTPVYRNGAVLNGTPYQNTYSGQVRAHIVASGDMTVIGDTTWIHENYDRYLDVQRRQTYITDKSHGTFLTFFELSAAGAASKWTVTPFSSTDQYAAASIVSTDGWTDWHISQTDASSVHTTAAGSNVSIDSGALESNAQYSYLRRVGSTLDSAMMSRGTLLSSNGDKVFGTSSPVTASMLFDTGDPNVHKGTVSADDLTANTVLTVYNPGRNIASATLDGNPISFNNMPGAKSVTLAGSGGGSLVINYNNPIDGEITLSTASASFGKMLVGQTPTLGSAPTIYNVGNTDADFSGVLSNSGLTGAPASGTVQDVEGSEAVVALSVVNNANGSATSGNKNYTYNITNDTYPSDTGHIKSLSVTADIYQAASVTVTGGTAINISNAATSDGGQRAATRLRSMTFTSGYSGMSFTLAAGVAGVGTVINEAGSVNATPSFPGNPLNGTYSANYTLVLEHDDQTILGTSANDNGSHPITVTVNHTSYQGVQSSAFTAGTNISNFWANSNLSFDTNAYFLDGVLSNNRTINTSWQTGGVYSDILSLTGLAPTPGSETFVLQMNAAGAISPSEAAAGNVYLAWLNGSSMWVNAVEGNSGFTLVGSPILRAYNPGLGDFVAGKWGVDVASGTVWAVLNHNSDFTVINPGAIPEPASAMLLIAGSSLLMMRRRRA